MMSTDSVDYDSPGDSSPVYAASPSSRSAAHTSKRERPVSRVMSAPTNKQSLRSVVASSAPTKKSLRGVAASNASHHRIRGDDHSDGDGGGDLNDSSAIPLNDSSGDESSSEESYPGDGDGDGDDDDAARQAFLTAQLAATRATAAKLSGNTERADGVGGGGGGVGVGANAHRVRFEKEDEHRRQDEHHRVTEVAETAETAVKRRGRFKRAMNKVGNAAKSVARVGRRRRAKRRAGKGVESIDTMSDGDDSDGTDGSDDGSDDEGGLQADRRRRLEREESILLSEEKALQLDSPSLLPSASDQQTPPSLAAFGARAHLSAGDDDCAISISGSGGVLFCLALQAMASLFLYMLRTMDFHLFAGALLLVNLTIYLLFHWNVLCIEGLAVRFDKSVLVADVDNDDAGCAAKR
jgi:hypothetical protein